MNKIVKYDYCCEFCNKKFDNKEDCASHELSCVYKISKEIKRIVCWFKPMVGSFLHNTDIKLLHTSDNFSHLWYELDDDNNERPIYIEYFDDVVDENKKTIPKYFFCYSVYTCNLDKKYEIEMFNKMHEYIFNDVERLKRNCENIYSDDFKNYGLKIEKN